MPFMMRFAPITFPIAMLAGLGWCIGIALLEQPYGIGYALTRYCLMVFLVLAPWLTLKLTFYVIVSLGRKLGLIPPARPTFLFFILIDIRSGKTRTIANFLYSKKEFKSITYSKKEY